jgi:hypothetical protein
MKDIKPTTKAVIKETVIELNEISGLIDHLVTQHNVLRGIISVTFSENFTECNQQSEYMKIVSDQFNDGIFDLVKLYNSVYDLGVNIQPALGNNHWEDLQDSFYDKTKGPQN